MKRTLLLKENQLYLYFKELHEIINACDINTYIMLAKILTYNFYFYYSKNKKNREDRNIIDRYILYV